MSTTASPASLIAATVAERARQLTPEEVRTSCSLARAERLLGREYHGRFLIELLQNAADAWRKVASETQRSKVLIAITNGPALLVANRGEAFPASAVIKSLGHIGDSTKPEGEAIGHKGIGVKSVLEMTLTPELYSNLQQRSDRLALRFDPRVALETIRAASLHWDEHVKEIAAARSDPLVAVPVLRFPQILADVPAEIDELAEDGFDTVVRLPFNDNLRPSVALDRDAWLEVVRDALHDVTDQMLLLLGTFDEVSIEDRLAGANTTVRTKWDDATQLPGGVRREEVGVTRNDVITSRWRLYRQTLPDATGLASEIAVGVRVSAEHSQAEVIALDPDEPSAPFHLFFPIKLASGLPLLLHGYFKVNAARTSFYEGNAAENQAILDGLATLVRDAVEDTACDPSVDVTNLVNILGAINAPEDRSARDFRDRVYQLLDIVDWIPLQREADSLALGKPTRLLVHEESSLIRRVATSFLPTYIARTTGLDVPAANIDGAGHRFLVSRRPADAADLWEVLGQLCRPGDQSPWPNGDEESRV